MNVTNRDIPSEKDWGNYSDDFDQKSAHETFFGKSRIEAMPAFESNAIERASELQFIAPIPFQYYMLAFCDYVMSQEVLENPMASDAASSFLRLALLKLHEDRSAIAPIAGELLPALEYVANNQELFDADVSIYGNFLEKVDEIKRLI